jgi:PAS domain S-box-containing protein
MHLRNYLINESPVDEITFGTLAEKMLSGILIVGQSRVYYINNAFEQITGYSREDILDMSPWDMVHPDERTRIRKMGLKRFRKGNDVRDYYETQWIHKEGHLIWVEVRAVLLKNTSPPKILANIVDISARKKALATLKKREEELKIQAANLEETNIALKVILKQRNEEVEELKRNIQFNLEKLVLPYLDNLSAIEIKPQSIAYLQTVKDNLIEITAPHIRKFSSQYARLSPKQIEVINLIRQGKTSKEIADILVISKAAVDFHRSNVRKKLGLNRKKINLQTFLELQQPLEERS